MVRTHRNFQLLSDAQSYGFRYETYLDATFEALAGRIGDSLHGCRDCASGNRKLGYVGQANGPAKTDDAYLRADVTPWNAKVAGLVASVAVSDYEPVKAGDLLVRFTSRAGDASRAHRPVLSRPRGPVRRCERRKCGRRKGTDARELTASRSTKDDQTSSLFSVVTYAAHLLDLPVATRNPAYPNPLRRILLWTVLPGMQPTVRGEGVRILIHSRAGNKQQN
jgi:hypothetical protein